MDVICKNWLSLVRKSLDLFAVATNRISEICLYLGKYTIREVCCSRIVINTSDFVADDLLFICFEENGTGKSVIIIYRFFVT